MVENKYARRIGDIKSTTFVIADVYEVLVGFDVSDPAIQHAIKKLLLAGERGAKSRLQDLTEAWDAINRAIAMEMRSHCDKEANEHG